MIQAIKIKNQKINISIKNNTMKKIINLLLVFILFVNCNSQEKNYIDTKFKIDKEKYNSIDGTFKSENLDNLLSVKDGKYYISEVSGTKTKNYYITPVTIVNGKSYLLIYNNQSILTDTLLIPKKNVFSINVEFENKKNGICIGIFNDEESFFKINSIYELSLKNKINKLSINTKIIKCPLPLDYLSEENLGIEEYYKYGIKKKSDNLNSREISFSDLWSNDCESNTDVFFDSVITNAQFSVIDRFCMNAQYKKIAFNTYEFYFTDFPPIIPRSEEMQNWNDLDKTRPIGVFEIKDEKTIAITWNGFYHKKLKKIIETENPFTNKVENTPILLHKCK